MSQGSILDRLSALDTNTVSDALDFLGIKGATYGLRPLWDCPKIVGRASTVRLGPKTDAAPAVHLLTPVIDAITTDDRILVISRRSRGHHAGAISLPMPRKRRASVEPSSMA